MKRATKKFLVLVLVLFSASNSLASLDLVIYKSTYEMDWIDGTGVTRTSRILDNNFGVMNFGDLSITDPLPEYVGTSSFGGVAFDLSADLSMIEGVLLYTLLSENPTSFFGTPEGPSEAILLAGSFSMIDSLTPGTYELAPVGDWDGGVKVTVVPEPGTVLLFGLGGLILRRKR